MNQPIEVTAKTLLAFTAFRDALRDNLVMLARVTEKYPVECVFFGNRFVFASKAEIEEVISQLDSEITRLAA
jgi:hypothetical protein